MSGTYQIAQLFGESDEQKAARLQMEQSQNASINYTRQKVQDLESSVRRLTGALEEQDHRITELNNRIERMQRDFDYRLCTLAQQQLGSAGGEQQGSFSCGNSAAMMGSGSTVPPPVPEADTAPPPTPPSRAMISPTAPPARAPGQPLHLAPPPGNLGSLPANASAANLTPYAAPGARRGKFDSAMKLLTKAQYDEARSAFRAFADSYPQDELAPQAVYWIGDIALVQKDYPGAAHAFAEEIKKYPDSARAPDSMLKLGQSLIAMGQKQEGCTALAALPTKYPTASKTVVDRATQERKASTCR
jgi:tol-pal system protein YbgF